MMFYRFERTNYRHTVRVTWQKQQRENARTRTDYQSVFPTHLS
jgi:hypothetical protein